MKLLPIVNCLLLSKNGTVFHLTSIINSATTNDVTIFLLDHTNHKVSDILDETLKYVSDDRVVTVLRSFESNRQMRNRRHSAINVVLFESFYKVYHLIRTIMSRSSIIFPKIGFQ